jgi:hypothetical protein
VEDYAGCQCIRADQISRSTEITTDISDHIQRSRFLIADLTDSNPNVFYEVGFSLALEKDVILLLQEGFKAPFDIQGIRYIRYSKSTLPDLAASLNWRTRQDNNTCKELWHGSRTGVCVAVVSLRTC